MPEQQAAELGIDLDSAVCGAVVCNCDPFTLGHRHLIEYAAAHSDFLYVFAVSEAGSMFTPEERLEMIQEGTADMRIAVCMKASCISYPVRPSLRTS